MLPFFIHTMYDVLAKHHFGNGMFEYGRSLLVDAIVDKQLISIRIKSIAVEAFGRHLKRVDASALFLFGCKIWPVKTYISVGERRSCGCFPLTCNFTDALLLSLNSLRLAGKGLTEIGFFLNVPTVMRPCDGTSGLVRGNRR